MRVFILLMALLFLIALPVMSAERVERSETQILMDGGVLLSADVADVSVISIPALPTQVFAQTSQHNVTTSAMISRIPIEIDAATLDAYDKIHRTAISIAGSSD